MSTTYDISPDEVTTPWTDDPEVQHAIVTATEGGKIQSLIGAERVMLAKFLLDEKLEQAKQYVRDAQAWKKQKEESHERAVGFLKDMLGTFMQESNYKNITTPSGSCFWRKADQFFIVGASDEDLLKWIETLSPDLQAAFTKVEKKVNMPALKKAIQDGTITEFPFATHVEHQDTLVISQPRGQKGSTQ